MSMVLVLYQASDATIDRILADPPLVWQLVAPDEPELYDDARRRTTGLFARLSSRNKPTVPLELGGGEGELADLDKAWHGLHYLLTQSANGGTPPLDFLTAGGTEIAGQEVGYGPARAFRATEVKSISEALERVSAEDLRGRYDAAAMMRADVYPGIWDRHPPDDDPLGYLMENLDTLRGALRTLVNRKSGLVVTLV
jgi:Domain of unknown function (DUF1877)